jgi:hypothetical protein
MAKLRERWTRFFTEPLVPDTAFQVSRGAVSGIRYSRKEKRVAAYVIRPIPPGTVDPAFDRPNVAGAGALDAALKDAVRRLGSPAGGASLLIPETCVKTALLSFESLPASSEEREAVLRWRLAKTLPLKTADLRLSFDVFRADGGERAFCVLALGSVIQGYEQAFARAGLRLRLIGLPTPHLLGLIPKAEAADVLVVNVEDDHLTLLAVCDGEIALFRVKAFASEAAPAEGGPWAQAATEAANTIHFLEDREKKRVKAVWIRASGGPSPDGAALEERVGCPVRAVRFAAPAVTGSREQAILAPLIGQVS